MDDFETFKASREKIDPSSRKFTNRQWQKAYSAYCDSRKRLEKTKRVEAVGSQRVKKASGRRGAKSAKPGNRLRSWQVHQIRDNSAYNDLRTLLDLLAWVAIGLIVLIAGVKLSSAMDAAIALTSILNASLQVIGVVVFRILAHTVIDIPDIALNDRKVVRQRSEDERQRTEDRGQRTKD